MSQPGMQVKAPIMVAAVVLSFLLWLAVQLLQPRSAQIVPIPLKVFTPTGFVVSSYSPDVALVRVGGTEEQIRMIEPRTTNAYVDIGELAPPGRRAYPIRLVVPRRFTGEAELQTTTAMVTLEPERRRILSVTVDTVGEIAAERFLEYTGSIVEPKTVSIIGQESVVRQADRARVIINLDEAEPESAVLQIVEVVDEKGNPLTLETEPQAVRVRPQFRTLPAPPVDDAP